jgi:hypothetical protein
MARITLTQNPQLEWYQSDAISYGADGIAPLIKLADQLGHYYTADQAEASTLHRSRLFRDIGLLTLRAVAEGELEYEKIGFAEGKLYDAADLSIDVIDITTRPDNVADMSDQRLAWAEHGATITSLGRIAAYRGLIEDDPNVIETALELFDEAHDYLHAGLNPYYTTKNATQAALTTRIRPGITLGKYDTFRWMRIAKDTASAADSNDPDAILARTLVRKTRPLTFAPKNFVRKVIQTKP